ncbi:MAG: TIGR03985 family CRISPR-associated protein [Elainellaceae cyanobacterium]
MSDLVWRDPPSIPLLQWLARGTLKQNLLQAIRLWVWLHLLYGDRHTRLLLAEPFSYADWRDVFFTLDHPTGEAKPDDHNPNCPCAKVTAAWLFGDRLTSTQADWTMRQQDPIQRRQTRKQADQFRQSLQEHGVLPDHLERLLHQTRLFGMTRRTLAGDLQILAEMHWLQRVGQGYQTVAEWPEWPRSSDSAPDAQLSARNLAFLTQPDLAAIADSFSQDIQGQRRFFVHVDYVVAQQWIDRVDDWQDWLRAIWQQEPVPPVQLKFRPAGATSDVSLVVYPVCIYYYRRGPYLCGYGQRPHLPKNEVGWLNYRLDRIQDLHKLNWRDAAIPRELKRQYQSHQIPKPEDIQGWMADAWGFDYYQPAQLLLLRFDQEWNRRYIRNSLRHETFQPIAYPDLKKLIEQELDGTERDRLLTIWRSRPATDAYYQAMYRRGDPNVYQRLRAWRPHVEVLLPWELRQRMKTEIEQERVFYGDE